MPDFYARIAEKAIDATATVAAGAANVAEITITTRDGNGKPVGNVIFDVFLSDSAVGNGYTASTASGAVTVKTAGTTGNLLFTYLAKFGLLVQSTTAGVFILSITDTNKVAFKIAVKVDGVVKVVATLATASYGP
jgi:hypothetical protein